MYPKIEEYVWKNKFNVVVSRAKRSFSNDKLFLAEVSKYEKLRKNKQSQKKTVIILGAIIGIVALIYFSMGLWEEFFDKQNQSKAKEDEIVRLELILENINLAINENNFEAAENLINKLVWKYKSNSENFDEEIMAWEKQRNEVIEKMELIKHSAAKDIEKERLFHILDNITIAINEKNLEEAENLSNQLVWKLESDIDDHEVEKKAWDDHRKEALNKINTTAKEIENEKLKQILENANIAIKDQKLDEAEKLVNQLIWEYESDIDECIDEKNYWDKQQKEIIKNIQKLKTSDEDISNEENSLLDH